MPVSQHTRTNAHRSYSVLDWIENVSSGFITISQAEPPPKPIDRSGEHEYLVESGRQTAIENFLR